MHWHSMFTLWVYSTIQWVDRDGMQPFSGTCMNSWLQWQHCGRYCSYCLCCHRNGYSLFVSTAFKNRRSFGQTLFFASRWSPFYKTANNSCTTEPTEGSKDSRLTLETYVESALTAELIVEHYVSLSEYCSALTQHGCLRLPHTFGFHSGLFHVVRRHVSGFRGFGAGFIQPRGSTFGKNVGTQKVSGLGALHTCCPSFHVRVCVLVCACEGKRLQDDSFHFICTRLSYYKEDQNVEGHSSE